MPRVLASLVLALVLGFAARTAAAEEPLTVVELFTSQGCSSCPPADAFLGELAKRDDVLALSLHVDYWDYIGWKDPFASAEHTRRQRRYAERFSRHYVYTPQMVVQGTSEETGSNRDGVLALIAKAKAAERIAVGIRHDAGRAEVTVSVPKGRAAEESSVWLVTYDRSHQTRVKRGENSGRLLTNHNVVRDFRRIGTWRGEALEIAAPMAEIARAGGDACAVIVQSDTSGRILGAARIALDGR